MHFKAYFTEEIVESPIETERPRFLDVYYYLVDDSGTVIFFSELKLNVFQGLAQIHEQQDPRAAGELHPVHPCSDPNHFLLSPAFSGTALSLPSLGNATVEGLR